MKRSLRTPEERRSTRSDEFCYGVSNKLKRTKMENKFLRPLSDLTFMRPTENKSKENLEKKKNGRNFKPNNTVNNASSSRKKIDDRNDFLGFDKGDVGPARLNENRESIQDKSLLDASTMTDHQCCSWVHASVNKMLDEKQDLLFGKIETLLENSINQKLLEAETKTGLLVSKILQEERDLLLRKMEMLIESIGKESATGKIDDSPSFSFDHTQSDEACDPVDNPCFGTVKELVHSSEANGRVVDTLVTFEDENGVIESHSSGANGRVVDKRASETVEKENGVIEELAHSSEANGHVVDKLCSETIEKETYSSDEDDTLDDAINEIVVKFPFYEIKEAEDLNKSLQEPTFFASMDKYVLTTGQGAKATLDMFNHIFSKKLQSKFNWDNKGTTIQSFPNILSLIHSAGRKAHKKITYEEKTTNEMIKNALRNARAKK